VQAHCRTAMARNCSRWLPTATLVACGVMRAQSQFAIQAFHI
jgi:hypothetical protein